MRWPRCQCNECGRGLSVEWAQLEVELRHEGPQAGDDGQVGTASVPLKDKLWRQHAPETLDLRLKGTNGEEVCFQQQQSVAGRRTTALP